MSWSPKKEKPQRFYKTIFLGEPQRTKKKEEKKTSAEHKYMTVNHPFI